MALSSEEVRQVARLARLELSDEEISIQSKHFNELLSQFDVLSTIDLTDQAPTSHNFPVVNVFRQDVVVPSLPRELVLLNAPETRDGTIIVPKILEG